jgi:hypothetical protein
MSTTSAEESATCLQVKISKCDEVIEEIKKNRRLTHKIESSKAFKDLEREINGEQSAPVVEDKKVSEVNTIQLLPVDNEEYKKRRAEALQKEGAVIGQITVR